jgi:hypothetical protein
MPQIETWSRLPAAVRAHLVERMHPQNRPRRPQSTSLMDGSEASAARGGMVQGLRFVQAVRRRPLSENILAGGAGGRGAEALTEHSRLITNPAAHSTAPATVSLPWTPLVLGSQHPSL